MSFQLASKTFSDVADLVSSGSLFQTEAAATTKARSPIEERRVMASKDDVAERRCFPGASILWEMMHVASLKF